MESKNRQNRSINEDKDPIPPPVKCNFSVPFKLIFFSFHFSFKKFLRERDLVTALLRVIFIKGSSSNSSWNWQTDKSKQFKSVFHSVSVCYSLSFLFNYEREPQLRLAECIAIISNNNEILKYYVQLKAFFSYVAAILWELSWSSNSHLCMFSPALTDGSLGDMLFFHSFRNPGLVGSCHRSRKYTSSRFLGTKNQENFIVNFRYVDYSSTVKEIVHILIQTNQNTHYSALIT